MSKNYKPLMIDAAGPGNNAKIISKTPDPPRGWLCPACGSGVAPNIHRCPCVALAPVSVPFVQIEPRAWPREGDGDPRPRPVVTTWPDDDGITYPGEWVTIDHPGRYMLTQ